MLQVHCSVLWKKELYKVKLLIFFSSKTVKTTWQFLIIFSLIYLLSYLWVCQSLTSQHLSVVRALNFKSRGCGFDSLAGQHNNYYLSFERDFKPRPSMTVLYTEHVKELGGALSSFVLYLCTTPRNN